jgi:2-polyprenyl-3-methyl-5-hydroxy-6-metoxy-1,4-benzoquinol methylase
LIILRHVLEHSYRPQKLLSELVALLSPIGMIYIKVPNLNSGCAKIFKKYWTLFYPPYHVFIIQKNRYHGC